MSTTPTIYMQASKFNDFTKLDVNIKNCPQDFLGLAFHLEVSNPQINLIKFEIGDLLKESDLLTIVKEQERNTDETILFGTTLKNDSQLKKQNGTVISFYLQNVGEKEITFNYSNTFLSIKQDGKRQNVQNSIWKNLTLAPAKLNSIQIPSYTQQELQKQQLITTYEFLIITFIILLIFTLTYVGLKFILKNKNIKNEN